MQKRKRSALVHLRFAPELKKAAEEAAAAEERSLTSMIEILLTEHLQQRGLMPLIELPKARRPRRSSSAQMVAA